VSLNVTGPYQKPCGMDNEVDDCNNPILPVSIVTREITLIIYTIITSEGCYITTILVKQLISDNISVTQSESCETTFLQNLICSLTKGR